MSNEVYYSIQRIHSTRTPDGIPLTMVYNLLISTNIHKVSISYAELCSSGISCRVVSFPTLKTAMQYYSRVRIEKHTGGIGRYDLQGEYNPNNLNNRKYNIRKLANSPQFMRGNTPTCKGAMQKMDIIDALSLNEENVQVLPLDKNMPLTDGRHYMHDDFINEEVNTPRVKPLPYHPRYKA